MTLPVLVRWIGLTETESQVDAERQARLALTQSALDRLAEMTQGEGVPDDVTDGLRAQYLGRLRVLEMVPSDEAMEAVTPSSAVSEVILRHALIGAQRETLADLRARGAIGATTLRRIEHDLDLEEARMPDVVVP